MHAIRPGLAVASGQLQLVDIRVSERGSVAACK